MMRWLSSSVLALFVSAAVQVPAYAWSASTHRLIAQLAYARVSPGTRTQIDALIATQAATPVEGCPLATLNDASTWADCVRKRPQFAWTGPLHYDATPVCVKVRVAVCPDGMCVTGAIDRYQGVLADRQRSDRERLEAFAFLTHAIEDVHQPLHGADNGDRIGTKTMVDYLGRTEFVDDGKTLDAQLHWVWDEALVDALLASDQGSRVIEATADRPGDWRAAPSTAWSEESWQAAARFVYPALGIASRCRVSPVKEKQVGPRVTIEQSYVDVALPIVRERLARAVTRLADRWEAAFGAR